jgi:rubrerythrin
VIAPGDRLEQLFHLFRRAIEEERKAQEMYRSAIALCDDEQTRRALQVLHDDEVRHEQEIMEQYNLLQREHPDPVRQPSE